MSLGKHYEHIVDKWFALTATKLINLLFPSWYNDKIFK